MNLILTMTTSRYQRNKERKLVKFFRIIQLRLRRTESWFVCFFEPFVR